MTANEMWTVVIGSLGGTAVILGIAYFLFQNLIQHNLSRNLESLKAQLALSNEHAKGEIAEKLGRNLEAFKSQLALNNEQAKGDIAERIERLKDDMRRISEVDLNESKLFSEKIYSRRLKALDEIYPTLLRIRDILKSIRQDIRPLRGDQSPDDIYTSELKLYSEKVALLYGQYLDNRLFLPEQVRVKMDELFPSIDKFVHIKYLGLNYAKDKNMREFTPKMIEESGSIFDQSVQPLIELLENLFQQMTGEVPRASRESSNSIT